MTLADRMIVMNQGNVEHIGTPLEVYTKPRTLFTAQFIGSPAMNILKGNCQNNKVTFANNASLPTNSKFNGSVNVGLRPEDFKLEGKFDKQAERIGRMVAPLMMKNLASNIYEKVLKRTK